VVTRFALLAVLATSACGSSDDYDPLCPEGWEPELTGACTPPARMYEEFPGTSGVFGYVKQRSCAPHCEDIVEELPMQRVMVFPELLPEDCGPDDEFGWNSDPSADPVCGAYLVDEVETDDEGVFTIELPPGDYRLITATKVFDNWEGRKVTLAVGFPQFVSFYFDALPI
jgi:hypothetical protein